MIVTKGASLMCCLREVDDPRKQSNGTLHDFVEMRVIAIAAVLSDCDTIEDIAYWGRTKEPWLREFLVLDGADKTKTSLRLKRKRAAWDDDLRLRILGLKLPLD